MRSEHIENHGTVQIWRCPGCAFGFDAIHVMGCDDAVGVDRCQRVEKGRLNARSAETRL